MTLPDLTDAIVNITSAAPNNGNFGTAFIVARDERGDYLLTCQHVVNVVSRDAIRVNDTIPATVIAEGDERGFDLALLRVEPGLLNAKPLRLSAAVSPCGAFMTRGYYLKPVNIANAQGGREEISMILSERIPLSLDAQPDTRIARAGRNIALLSVTANDPKASLLPGYSGAPLLDETTGDAIGVISISEGRSGSAIAARDIRTFWPEQAARLFRGIALEEILKEPIMNLERELPEFRRIVAKENQETRLINIYGEPGVGKTHLLDLYRRIANAHGLQTLQFELETGISFEKCLYQIVSFLGPEHFTNYDKLAEQGRGKMTEDAWQQNLTRKFFMDVKAHPNLPPLLIFFDSYNHANPEASFKTWLRDYFFIHLAHCRSFLMVVAGQERIQPLPAIQSHWQTFELQRLLPKHFYDYAAKKGVQLPQPMIDAMYLKDNGKPKYFVEMIQAFAAVPGGAI